MFQQNSEKAVVSAYTLCTIFSPKLSFFDLARGVEDNRYQLLRNLAEDDQLVSRAGRGQRNCSLNEMVAKSLLISCYPAQH